MARYKAKPLFSKEVTSELAWASSAYAYRILETYTKYVISPLNVEDANRVQYSADGLVENARLAHYAIQYPEILKQEDYDNGNDMRNYYKGLVFKALQTDLNDFEKTLLQVVERNDWNDESELRLHFGVLCSIARSYQQQLKRDNIDEHIASYDSEHFGNLKERMELKIQVLRNVFSKKWNTTYITAVTTDSNIVYFAFNGDMVVNKVYDIKGTVKAHRNNNQTQLNRVKKEATY